ncbi:MAG: sugar transferase [Chloroflexi bacterium]|jgi:lipopolysaccharide/colanic/teichoic acid biosynthesis glycosyltransferase|nr:sugar transferase [Chloroflexota bacterium]
MNTHRAANPVNSSLKRLIDIVVVIFSLLLLWPVMLIIAIAIKLDSKGPVIYRHKRVGKDGVTFHLYKFRSMVSGGDDSSYIQYLKELIESERNGNGKALPYRKLMGDPRITRVGRVIRSFYLDELPQLWNILKGDMSLVGPRPHVQLEVEHYTPEQRRRLSVKPGATGLWQVTAKADSSFSELIDLDLQYIDNWSIWLDLKIILMTVALVLKGGEGFWTRMAKKIPARSSSRPRPAENSAPALHSALKGNQDLEPREAARPQSLPDFDGDWTPPKVSGIWK